MRAATFPTCCVMRFTYWAEQFQRPAIRAANFTLEEQLPEVIAYLHGHSNVLRVCHLQHADLQR